MNKKQKESLLVNFYRTTPIYKRLAEYFMHIFEDDPSAPNDNIYTINYRIKNGTRLVEKITNLNKRAVKGEKPISVSNYKDRVGDMLGIRIICLRLSDIELVQSYLDYLAEERIITYILPPTPKKSFILPVDPGALIDSKLMLGSTGYSSIHYQIALGSDSKAATDLHGVQFELQLRTILEEAWGEIDHKYRYMNSRVGIDLPDHIHSGFYNLSAYLQVAAQQAEYLCRQAESQILLQSNRSLSILADNNQAKSLTNSERFSESIGKLHQKFQMEVEKVFGIAISSRTITYIYKRFVKFGFAEEINIVNKIVTIERLKIFTKIFNEILKREPFLDRISRNIDVVNAVNYSLINEVHGNKIAQEGLRSVLTWREQHSRR